MPVSTNDIAVVTGAGTGIGRAVALTLVEAGYRVVLGGRGAAKLEEVVAEADERLRARDRMLCVPTDVSETDLAPVALIENGPLVLMVSAESLPSRAMPTCWPGENQTPAS